METRGSDRFPAAQGSHGAGSLANCVASEPRLTEAGMRMKMEEGTQPLTPSLGEAQTAKGSPVVRPAGCFLTAAKPWLGKARDTLERPLASELDWRRWLLWNAAVAQQIPHFRKTLMKGLVLEAAVIFQSQSEENDFYAHLAESNTE